MFDWHSEYLVIQARQREMAGAARFGRLLAEARSLSQARRGRLQHGLSLRHRFGATLIMIGNWLQETDSRLPHAAN